MRDARFTFRGMVLPVLLDRIPKVEETTVICVAVLYDEARDLFRMAQCETIANRSAVIHDIHDELGQSKILYQFLDKVRLVFEGVRKCLRIGHAAQSISNVIRRNHMKVRGELRDEVPKHVGGSRKPVQKKYHWSIGWACFTVEELLLIDGYGFVVDGIGLGWGWRCGSIRHLGFSDRCC